MNDPTYILHTTILSWRIIMNNQNSYDGTDKSAQSEQSDRSDPPSQSDNSEHSSKTSRTDPSESSETSSGNRRKANRGEMEPLVEDYIKQGLSAPDIVDRVYNVDRLLTYQGRKLDAARVYTIKNKMKGKEPSVPSEPTDRRERKPQLDRPTRSYRSERPVRSQQPQRSGRLEDSFRLFKELPLNKREGRKETRKYTKFNTTLDIELWKRFEAEKDRRRWEMVDMLELILYNAFGHPALTYGEPEVSEPEPEKPKVKSKRARKR
jgi:hypothetical protein